MLWLGKSNFTGSFMKESTAYKALFVHDFSRDIDFEAIERDQVFSLERKKSKVDLNNMSPLSYHGTL